MNTSSEQLFGLQEHCARLSTALASLWRLDPVTLLKDAEALEYGTAADWLQLAAGVCKVEILTRRFDDSLMYCSTAMEYEDSRSELLTRLATALTVFSFTWGALETVAKIVDPPSIPVEQRSNGANGLIDRILFFIKIFPPLPAYRNVLGQLDGLLISHARFSTLLQKAPLPPHMGESGVGLDFVRRVRNKFAHGAAALPLPDDCSHGWCGKRSIEPHVIGLSTRIVLLTMQMVLSAFYQGKSFDLYGVLEDEDGYSTESDVHLIMSTLHIPRSDPEETA